MVNPPEVADRKAERRCCLVLWDGTNGGINRSE